jgi:DNA-binding MarR family transcriptional regulator
MDAMTSDPTDCAAGDEACNGVDGDLGWALGVVFRSYVKATNVALGGVPGGPRGYQVLTTAMAGPPRTQLALAQQLGIDRTVMTYLLDDIERAGLVERRPDPADRRARQVQVTDKGQDLAGELRERLEKAEDHVLGSLGEHDRDKFRSLLRRLALEANAADPVHYACDVVEEMHPAEKRTRGRR